MPEITLIRSTVQAHPHTENHEYATSVGNLVRILWSALPFITVKEFWKEVETELGRTWSEELYEASKVVCKKRMEAGIFGRDVFICAEVGVLWAGQAEAPASDLHSLANLFKYGIPFSTVHRYVAEVANEAGWNFGFVQNAFDDVVDKHADQEEQS